MPVRVGPDRLRSGGLPENERSAPVRGRPVLESGVELRRSAPVDRRSVAGRADAGRSVDGRAAEVGPTNLAAPGPWTASLLMIAPLGACSFFGLYCRLCLDYFESSAT